MQKLEEIRWGIIGVGDVCEVKSAPAMNRIEGSRLVAVMRRNGEKAADYARRHGVPKWYDDAGQLINDPEAAASIPHIDYVREAGSEGIELVMWLIARGAMADVAGGAKPKVVQRFYHVPASNTAVGHLILENS